MGGLPWPESTLVDGRPQGIWTRLIGWDGSYEGHEDGVLGGSPTFDYSFYALQLGADLWRNDESEDMRDRAGIYGVLGHADGSVEHDFGDETVDAGDTTFDAFTLGGYFTRTGPSDWYVDAVLQYTWYNIEMTSARGLGSVDTDAGGLAASIEGGYPYPIGDDGWAVEPQAQLVYQTLNIDDFEDIAAEVEYEDTDSLAGRIGARVFREWADTGVGRRAAAALGLGPRQPLARPDRRADDDLLRRRRRRCRSSPSSTSPGPSSRSAPTSRTASGWSVFGDAAYQVTFDGDADSIGGELGLKYRW